MPRRFRRRGRARGARNPRGLIWTGQIDQLEISTQQNAQESGTSGLVLLESSDLNPGAIVLEPEGSTITRIRGEIHIDPLLITSGDATTAGVFIALGIELQGDIIGGIAQHDPNNPDDMAQRDWMWLWSGIAVTRSTLINVGDTRVQQLWTVPIDIKAQRKMRDQQLVLMASAITTFSGDNVNDNVTYTVSAHLRTLIRMPG